jgi:hypothetical protein
VVATALAAACVCLAGCGVPGGSRAADPITASPTPASEPVTTIPDRDVPDIPISDASVLAGPVEVERPVQVLVPDLGIDVPIDAVGVAADGQMEVPEDALRAGWYRFGPAPGQAGAAVVAAHAGSYITPRGPFYELTRAEPGMRIEVRTADGIEQTFEVVEVEIVTKDGLDLNPYFDRGGEPRLVLITCGGDWDDSAQSYRSNVIVSARLADE